MCLIFVPASAADAAVRFKITAGNAVCGEKLPVVLSVEENNGISGAALNLLYDSSLLYLDSYTAGTLLNSCTFSVSDNGYGQVRITFCDTNGFVRDTGEVAVLYFCSVKNAKSSSNISLKNETNALTGINYKPTSYTANTALATFSAFESSFESDVYKIDRELLLITGVEAGLPTGNLAGFFRGELYIPSANPFVGTGTIISVTEGGKTVDYTVIVKGDIDGSGTVNSSDYVEIRRHILGTNNLSDVFVYASDINSDGNVNSTDYILVRRHILGILDIYS